MDLSQKGDGGALLWDQSHLQHDAISTKTYGFWLYMLGDIMIFASLFAAYIVLSYPVNTAGGPTPGDVMHPVMAFWNTLLICTSALSYGYAMVALKTGHRRGVLAGLAGAGLLGLGFLAVEGLDLASLIQHGATAERSGFLSAFFTLVMAHGVHMVFGLIWIAVMAVQVERDGFTEAVVYRLLNLKIFWFFQAFIWISIFSFVYLTGVM